jgi:GH18 family chitinase
LGVEEGQAGEGAGQQCKGNEQACQLRKTVDARGRIKVEADRAHQMCAGVLFSIGGWGRTHLFVKVVLRQLLDGCRSLAKQAQGLNQRLRNACEGMSS